MTSAVTGLLHIGVEKHNDDTKCAYFSSNKWETAADIIKTEARIQFLRKFAAAKRPYQKHDLPYWDEGGIEMDRASRKKGATSTSTAPSTHHQQAYYSRCMQVPHIICTMLLSANGIHMCMLIYVTAIGHLSWIT